MPAYPMTEVDLVKHTIASGLNCLQIADNLPLHQLPVDRINTLKELIQKHNIRLELGARRLTPEHLNRYIDLAAFFGSPLLRFVVDGDQYEPTPDSITGIIRDALPLLEA
jgi:hypothetical protein